MFGTLIFLYGLLKLDFQVYFESDEVQAAIVTCGGLCLGLNTVIRELVCGLHHMYGVKRVLGIEVCGYVCCIKSQICCIFLFSRGPGKLKCIEGSLSFFIGLHNLEKML